MRILRLHPWDVSPREALAIQTELRSRVERRDRFGVIRRIAGVDVGLPGGAGIVQAAVVVLSFPGLELVEEVVTRRPLAFPYVPGLLSFRELPAVLDALEKLESEPDVLLCDAHGLAHPRRFGLACHLGLLVDTPSLGVAKSRLVGTHDRVPETRGGWRPLTDRGEVIGAVVRTRTRVTPVYVSIGHRLSLATAIDLVLAVAPRYRLPETTRRADRLASRR